MKKPLRLLFVTIVPLLVCACGENLFEQYANMPKDNASKTVSEVWTPSSCTIDQVVLKSFEIKSLSNRNVLADMSFQYRNDSTYSARVSHYSLAKDGIVPTWNGIAARVTVNGEDQVPGSTAVDFSSPVKYRFYASDGQYREISFVLEQGDCSGLPVMSMISDRMISDRYTWIPVTFKLTLPSEDRVALSGTANARFLNDNSMPSEKKSFELESDKAVSPLGMGPGRKWNLISNVPDRTYLRNKVAGEISSILDLPLAPSSEYCELFVNGEYMGLYLLSETVSAGVEMTDAGQEDAQDPEQSDYLFKLDWNNEGSQFKTAVMELPVNIIYPAGVSQSGELYARQCFKRIEQCLYQKELPDPEYRNLLDMASFAGSWIAFELTICENSRVPSSVWYFKDAEGKLKAGPVWNSDAGTFNSTDQFVLRDYETTDFNSNRRSLWYSRLFRDEEFVSAVKACWAQHKTELKNIVGFVDEQASVIGETAKSTIQNWPTDRNSNLDSRLPWNEAVDSLKDVLTSRWTFLDKSITSW